MSNLDTVPAILEGGGEMGTLMRLHDWSTSPLGSPDAWPQSLRSVVELLLNSKFPMFIAWGPELSFLYNDAYADILGNKHPFALGSRFQSIWAEIWNDIEPMVQSAMRGHATYRENLPLIMHRKGYDEQTWLTFSYSPVRDESGAVAGLFCACTETTKQFLADRRHTFQLQLADTLRTLTSSEDIITVATEMLGKHLNASRSWYVEINHGKHSFQTRGGWCASGLPDLPKSGRIDDYSASSGDALELGMAYVVNDVMLDERTTGFGAAYQALGIRSLLTVPVAKNGRTALNLNVSKSVPHHWSEEEIESAKDVADRTWLAVENALVQAKFKAERDESQSILDSMNEGFVLLDQKWRIVRANIMAAQIARHSLEELLRHNHWEVVPETVGTELESLYRRVRQTGVAEILEYHHTYPNGEHAWIELRAYPLSTGKLAVFFRNINKRKQNEESLRKSEAHLSALFEQTSAGICEMDTSARIINVNKRYCQILGRSEKELLGKYVQDLTHPDDLQRSILQFRHMVETGEAFEIEKRYLLLDGTAIWGKTMVSMIHTAGDTSASTVLAVIMDITEQKRAQEALQLADRRKDEFLAMLAHELRNPLAPISAAAELMEIVNLDQARIRETSRIISRQVNHMTGLVDDLLDVSRVTRGLVTINRATQDLKAIVASATEQVRPLIEAQRHHLSLDLPAAPVYVLGDQKRMVQIVANILNNSAKYTPEGGHIRVKLEAEGSQVRLTVLDNGIGISKELQPHVFELFAQAKRSSDRSQGGLGIGLALVKSLVELHQGQIQCLSDGIGTGSRFTITLPVMHEQQPIVERRRRSRDKAVAAKSLKILVVDDNIDAARMLATLLEACGHEVLVEHGSKRALERARIEMPQVCILDIGLPDIDGYELARRLKAQPHTEKSMLIAVTGYGQEQDRNAALEAGFEHHLVKPVDTTRLTSILSAIASN